MSSLSRHSKNSSKHSKNNISVSSRIKLDPIDSRSPVMSRQVYPLPNLVCYFRQSWLRYCLQGFAIVSSRFRYCPPFLSIDYPTRHLFFHRSQICSDSWFLFGIRFPLLVLSTIGVGVGS